MAFWVARIAGVGVDDLLAGKYPPAGVCARTAGMPWNRSSDRRARATDGPVVTVGGGNASWVRPASRARPGYQATRPMLRGPRPTAACTSRSRRAAHRVRAHPRVRRTRFLRVQRPDGRRACTRQSPGPTRPRGPRAAVRRAAQGARGVGLVSSRSAVQTMSITSAAPPEPLASSAKSVARRATGRRQERPDGTAARHHVSMWSGRLVTLRLTRTRCFNWKHVLASSPKRSQDLHVKRFWKRGSEVENSVRDGHVYSWATYALPESSSKRLEVGDWGVLLLTPPGPMGEPGDIRIEFKDTIEARQNALTFAQELHAEILRRFHELTVEFVRAPDHFHLLVGEPMMREARAASELVRAISTGAISGRGRPARSISASVTNHVRHRNAAD